MAEQCASGTPPALLADRTAHLLSYRALGWWSGKAVAMSAALVTARESAHGLHFFS